MDIPAQQDIHIPTEPGDQDIANKSFKFYPPRLALIALALALIVTVGFILFLLLSGKLSLSNQSNTSKSEIIDKKIRIGNVGEYSIFNIIAKEEGYFKKNGLDATITEYSSGPPAVTALLNGEEDFAIAADYVGVTNIFSNKSLRVLSQVSSQNVFQVIALKSAGISSPKDLKGKKIGVTRKSVGEFFLGKFLTFNNLSLSDVNLENLTPPQILEQLQNGKIDAAVTFEPPVYNTKKILGDKLLIWSAQGDQATYALAYTTDSYINSNKEVVDKYMLSLNEAEIFAQKYPEKAQAIINSDLHYEDKYSKYIWPKFNFGLSLNQELLLAMEDEGGWSIRNKLTDKTQIPNYLEYIYFNSLEKVKPDSITIVH